MEIKNLFIFIVTQNGRRCLATNLWVYATNKRAEIHIIIVLKQLFKLNIMYARGDRF